MVFEQENLNQSHIDSMKKNRDELSTKRTEVYKQAVATDAEVKKAIEACPKRGNTSSENLIARIERMELSIESSSMSAKEEKEEKRKIADLKKQLATIEVYEKAQSRITELKQTRDSLFKESSSLLTQINELNETIMMSEALLRLKKLTSRDFKSEMLARSMISIPNEKVGRLCGKGNANLHKMEAEFTVFIHNGREGFTILGEKSNVTRCEAMINDSLNEVEETVKLNKDEIRALMAHNNKYRHMIETDYHVMSRLGEDGESLRLIGGQNAVKQASRGIQDLFKKKTEVSVTPFARSLFLGNSMKAFKEVQETCACYLGMNKEFTSLVLYGTMEDQRQAVKIVNDYLATHIEVKEEVSCSFLFYNFLLNNKAKALNAIRQTSHAQLNGVKEKSVVTVSGLQETVTQAVELLNQKKKEVEESTLTFDLNGAQLNELLNKSNPFMKELKEKFTVFTNIIRTDKKLMILPLEKDQKEAIENAVKTQLDQIESVKLTISSRLIPLFIGVKGQNISTYQKKFGVQLDLQDKTGELVLSGQKEGVMKAKQEVEEWLGHHTLRSLEANYDTCMQCIVGQKGATRVQLEKELSVEIRVEKEGMVYVMGEPDLCDKAMKSLESRIKEYEHENKVITIREDILRNAPEFHPSRLAEKMKELAVEYQLNGRRHTLHIHGKEEVVEQATTYINGVLDQYQNYKQQQLDIPKTHIGSLVGKSGEHLHALEKDLHVVINTNKDNVVTLWAEATQLPAIEEAIQKDLKQRVIVTKEVACSVKQVEYLTADYNAVRIAIEDETGAKIYIPRNLPLMGPTTLTVTGNEEEVTKALPIVREAILGMVRQRIVLTPEELKGLLAHESIQIQRIQLESRCRIQADQETGEVLIVGPKEGIQLIYKRFWSALSALYPAKYHMLVLEEAVRLGLEDRAVEKEMKEEEKKEKCLIKIVNDCVVMSCPEGSEVQTFMDGLVQKVKDTNKLFFVGKEMISFIIGVKGARINQVKKLSGTNLRVLRDEVVVISGKPEAITKATELLENAVEEYKSTHVTMNVEEELVSAVRGIRNGNILNIQRSCMVRINVDNSGLITINGQKKEMVEKAKEELLALIERVKENPESVVRPMRENRTPRVMEQKKEEEVNPKGLWEKLKQAPLLPSMGKKTEKSAEVNRILGLNEPTVGGSACYKSESGYTVEL